MEALKLIESDQKPLHWKKERANSIYRIYMEEKKAKLQIPYGMVIGMLSKVAESVPDEDNKFFGWAWVDDDGEIQFEIPPIEEFENQYRAFLHNSYARTCNYALTLFFKQYGHYETVKEAPLRVKPIVKQTRVFIQCSDCGKNHYSDESCR